MRILEIQQEINEFVKKRDGLKKEYVGKALNIHYWNKDKLLCSTRHYDPRTTTDMDKVTCYWCKNRIAKRYHE